ncbi:MFS transporter, partial [Francisella tularensis subsp. holarctica]|nr:MFS transporter [Francisella tularensis subsp. holarctica]
PFHYLISDIIVYFTGGPLTVEINANVLDRAFIYLIIPILLSTIIIFTIVVDKYRNREISLKS